MRVKRPERRLTHAAASWYVKSHGNDTDISKQHCSDKCWNSTATALCLWHWTSLVKSSLFLSRSPRTTCKLNNCTKIEFILHYRCWPVGSFLCLSILDLERVRFLLLNVRMNPFWLEKFLELLFCLLTPGGSTCVCMEGGGALENVFTWLRLWLLCWLAWCTRLLSVSKYLILLPRFQLLQNIHPICNTW